MFRKKDEIFQKIVTSLITGVAAGMTAIFFSEKIKERVTLLKKTNDARHESFAFEMGDEITPALLEAKKSVNNESSQNIIDSFIEQEQ